MNMIKKIGTEVEFNKNTETELKTFFEILNYGLLYEKLLTRRRSSNRMYIENNVIFEYRSPVISSDSYFRFAKYYFFVSYFSKPFHQYGYHDANSGSMHTHLEIPEVDISSNEWLSKLNNLLILSPLMSRTTRKRCSFRDAVFGESRYAKITYMSEIYEDSKSYWITYNTGTDCIEIRLNENIPVWYILADKILSLPEDQYKGIDLVELVHDVKVALPEIRKLINMQRGSIHKRTYKSDIQKNTFIDLLNYLDFAIGRLEENIHITLSTFSEYLLNYSPMREIYSNLLDWYMEIYNSADFPRWRIN